MGGCVLFHRGLLNPELVHLHERIRIFLFELIPQIEISRRRVLGEPFYVFFDDLGQEVESEKNKAAFLQKFGNPRQRKAVLLHMEQKVTAFAQAEKITEA